jgi:hypothetical protein
VLRIFIALKNPSPWPDSKLQTLGPVVSTLTTIPPRQLDLREVGFVSMDCSHLDQNRD